MASRASLILRRLVVCRPTWLGCRKVRRWRMALQAQRVHARPVDEPRIGPAMREVARCAAFRLHYGVLIHKRPRCFAVALRAHRVHLRRSTQILAIECAVRIVTIRALHQPFFHLVMERHIELRLRLRVALEAELFLLNFQELLACLAVMNAVTADTTHIVLAMCCAFKVCVLPLMAA